MRGGVDAERPAGDHRDAVGSTRSVARSAATPVPYSVAAREPTIATDRSISCARCPGPRNHSPYGRPPRRWISPHVAQIVEPVGPFRIARHDEPRLARGRQPVHGVRGDPIGPLGRSSRPVRRSRSCPRLPQLRSRSTSATTAGSPPSVAQLSNSRACRSILRHLSPPLERPCRTARPAASPARSPRRPGRECRGRRGRPPSTSTAAPCPHRGRSAGLGRTHR